jgi:diadenosine tetraphosphate (Ap4A) HIT family hydrolase
MTTAMDFADAEVVDEDVVVLTSPGLVGLVVIPRHHVSGLQELPLRERAGVLAALRRVSVFIAEKYRGSAPRVVLTTDPPASRGHVGFQVVPGSSGV